MHCIPGELHLSFVAQLDIGRKSDVDMSFVLFSGLLWESQDAKKYDLVGDAFQVTGKLANVRTSALLSFWLVMLPVNVYLACFYDSSVVKTSSLWFWAVC